MFPHSQAGPPDHNFLSFLNQFPPAPAVDYDQLSNAVAERVVDRVAAQVAPQVVEGVTNQVVAGITGQVANLIASQREANEGAALTQREKKARERCGPIQRIITKVMLSGLRVSKVDEIGSPSQPGPLDIDGDDEGPWEIDWKAGPKGAVNREVVTRWVEEVMRNEDLIELHNTNAITDAQFTDRYIRSLLIHSFEAARRCIKDNEDESGERLEKLKASKEKSKRKERRVYLCSNRAAAAKSRFWDGKPIPQLFFKPEYHSDSDADPVPDLSTYTTPIQYTRYKELRNGADYEMLTPGWRSSKMTNLFHWLDKEHRSDTNNRPQGSRYYHYEHKNFKVEDIPDNAPRCMIEDRVYSDRMDDEKRGLVLRSPAGWEVDGE